MADDLAARRHAAGNGSDQAAERRLIAFTLIRRKHRADPLLEGIKPCARIGKQGSVGTTDHHRLLDIVLVLDIADDLFDHVFDRDQAVDAAMLVDDERQVRARETHLQQQIEKAQRFPNACKDEKGRLRVAAATGVGTKGIERAEALLGEEVDLIVVDTAHGHSEGVIAAVKQIKKLSNRCQVMAGNIATAEAARALIDAEIGRAHV